MVSAAPPPALEAMAASVSRNGASSLSAAYALMSLDAFAKTTASTTTLTISELGRDGRTQPLTLPSGAIPKVAVSQTAAKVQFGRSGQAPAYFVLAESGFDRNPPTAEVKQGVEISREFVDDKGNVLTRVTVGQEFFVRIRVRAMDRDRQPQIAIVDVLPGGVEPVLELQPTADSSTPGEDPALREEREASRRAGRQGSPPQMGRFGALPLGVAGKSDWAPHHLDVREDRIILYGDALSDSGDLRVSRSRQQRRDVPGASAVRRGDVQPHHRRTRQGRDARGDQAMKRVRVAIVVAIALVAIRFWPHAPLRARVPVSTGVWSADGELLRVTLAADRSTACGRR